MARIDGNISDLFFNTDVTLAAEHDKDGQFTGWDDTKLREEAVTFIGCLERLNIAVPTVDELLTDFHARV